MWHSVATAGTLAVFLGLAGCAPRLTSAVADHRITYSPYAKATIFDRALAEWHDWGSPTFDANGQPIFGTTTESYRREHQPEVFHKVLAYWSIFIGQEEYVDRQKRVFYMRSKTGDCLPEEQNGPADNHLWGCQPWSAAFISFVMQTSGIDQDEFRRGEGHRVYVDQLVDVAGRAKRSEVPPMFEPYEVSAYAPRAGDLVCADRSENSAARITTLAQRQAERRRAAQQNERPPARAMHCDLVMSVDFVRGRPRNLIYVLGGNVHDTVACVAYPTDADGRVTRETSRSWFAVFRNTIPDLPPVTTVAQPANSPPSLGCARPTSVLASLLPN